MDFNYNVAVYFFIAAFVMLSMIGADVNGPRLPPREVTKIIVTGLLWPVFVIVAIAHLFVETVMWMITKAHDIARFVTNFPQ